MQFHQGDRQVGETREARRARISNRVGHPGVAENISRDVGAFEILLKGKCCGSRTHDEPIVLDCLAMDDAKRETLMGAASVMDSDHIVLGFAHDDPMGPPVSIIVVWKVGDTMEVDAGCGLWCPPARDVHS
ncbi:hypothetical protein [Polymorphobacter megasporae]|uniref:hypothetical protein n=1 Tax=Glacieibacterium megasporae TaxID=2835787 RepID=UPI001C1E7827|nr:hypothetical protein [Polymorphobacter megasporae]UAJ10685.1 hypothetical protein KTC28_02750 [Polymorphobacter megasporae]